MKKLFIPTVISLSVMTLFSGCVLAFNLGGGKKDSTNSTTTNSSAITGSNASNNPRSAVGQQAIEPTIGQQLIDLQKAKDSGAITETEYEAEKAKLLNGK